MKHWLGCLAVLGLAACGGGVKVGDWEPTSPDKPGPAPGSMEAMVAKEEALYARFRDNTGGEILAPSVPTKGRAQFTGVAAFDKRRKTTVTVRNGQRTVTLSTPQYAGKATLDADFERSTVSGKITDFKAANGARMTGEMTLAKTTITGTQFGNNSGQAIKGNLAEDGRNMPINTGFYNGKFVGAKADGMIVDLFLMMGQPGGGQSSLSGTIHAAR